MTKIFGDFGAGLNSLSKIGHRETVNGTRRSDRKLPRDSTRPVRSKSVKIADDIERTERDAIDSQEQPAAGEDRGDLHLDECLKALSQRSKNTERHMTSRHKALEQADQLCAPSDGDELDEVRLRRVLDRSLSSYKPRELRTIIRNALEAHFTADQHKAGDDEKARQATGQRREQVMKMVVEACLDRLSQMKKVTPLQDFHPRIDSRFLDYACARWLLKPAEEFVNSLGGEPEALDAACGRLILGYKAFGRGLFARVLFDEVGDRGSSIIDSKMGEIARRGAALADAAMSSQLDALSRGDLYVTARIMRNAAWAYFLKRQTVYGLTRGLNPSAARRSAEKVVKGYSLEPKQDHRDWAENYSRPVGEKTGIGDKADVAGSGRRDGAVRDSELPRSAESQQATEWLAQAYPRYGDRVARGRGARKVHDELDALISESEASTSSAHSQPQSTSPMNAQPQSTSATQAAPASDQPQLSAERLFDLLAVGEVRTQASLANTHEASAGPNFEQPAAPDENFRQPSPLSARPRIDNTPIDYHEELPDRLQMSNVKLGEDELGRALLVPDDPQRRDENAIDDRGDALAALFEDMGGDVDQVSALPIAKPQQPDRQEEMDFEFSVEDLAGVPDDVYTPKPPAPEELRDRIVGAVQRFDIPALIDTLEDLVELSKERGIQFVFAMLADVLGRSQGHIQQAFARLYDAIDTAAKQLDDEANPFYEAPRFLDLAERLREWLIVTFGDALPTTIDEELIEAAREALLANPMDRIDDVLVPEPRNAASVPGDYLNQPALIDRNRIIRDLDEMDEELAALGAEFPAGNEEQQLLDDEVVERGNALDALYADLGGEDLDRAVAADRAPQSAWVPAEPAGRAPRVPNAKTKDPNRAPPSWMKGGNRLANRDKEERIEKRAKRSSLSVEDLIAYLGSDKSSSRPGKPKPRQHVPSARPAWQPDLPSRAKRKELVLPQSRRERMQEAAGKVFSAIMDRNIEDYLMGLDAYNRAILTFGGDTAYAPIVQGVMDSFAEEDQDKMMANMGVLHAAVTSAVEQFGEGGAQLANLRTTNDNMWRNFGSIETIATTREVGVGTRTLHALYGVEGASLGLVRQPRAKGAKTSTVDADSVDPNTPTTSPRSVGWKPKSPRRNPEELSDTLVASILGQDFGQALRALHELARPGVSRRQIAKLVGESFRSSNTDPTAANVGKFQAIVSSLGTWPRAVTDKRAGRRLRETVDNMVRLWSQLKRDPYISGVEHSKISDEELKSAIAMVKELDAMESPPAHDRPKLLKKPSRPGAKPTLRKA